MARARKVVSDQNSQEFDELRRQFNNLLAILEVAADLGAIQTAIAAGVDTAATGREINGVRPTPTHPRRPRVLETEELGTDY
jgi:hypothetical protein